MPKRWRYTIITLCLCAAFLLLWQSPPKPLSELFDENTQPAAFPVTYFIGARTQQFDENGWLQYQLGADSITHYEPAKPNYSTLFIKPELVLYQKTDAPWEITADMATANEQQDELLLSGNVVITSRTREGTPKQQPLHISTETLRIKPRSQYAETDKPVIIKDAFSEITTVGLKVFFDQQRLEFLSNVSSTHKPY